jgi:hypothetical protein
MNRRLRPLLALCWLLAGCLPALAAPPSILRLADGTAVSLRTYPAAGDALLLWLACDEGQGTREAQTAQVLAAEGIEVWLPDFLGAHFLPPGPSGIKQIPGEEVAALIELARPTGKRLYLVSAGAGALPVLSGARRWQDRHPDDPALAGAILFYPELYAVTPAPGVEARYHPVVSHTRLPLFIYHSQRSPGRWWLEHLKVELRRGGSRVDSRILPGVRGYFYVRQDATAEEEAMAARLPELLREALKNLRSSEGELKP